MSAQSLDRIRFVTRHFNDLQGLRYGVPLGLITLGLGGLIHFEGWPRALFVPLAAGAFVLMYVARRSYGRRFGTVDSEPAYAAGELHDLSVYSPAGSPQRLEGFQQVTPLARHFFVTVALIVSLFTLFELVPPNILIAGGESMGRHPEIQAEMAPPYDSYLRWVNAFGSFFKSPPAFRALCGQMTYALFGAIFLGVWLWRERRTSQGHYLFLAIPLLGLAVLGASLGFLARNADSVRSVDFLLPALVYPGMALLLCGAAMVVAGLLDHWQLARLLNPSMEEQS
jgi:hypothetical protein